MMRSFLTLFIVASVISCTSSRRASVETQPTFDYQGHRGARGLMPENTIAAMKAAIDYAVTTVELDVTISKDNKVVVSHDPFFNEVITTTPDGKHLSKKQGEELVLYKMTYDEIKQYDVGLKPHPGFPQQQRLKAYKPLLSELIDSVETYARSKGKTIKYNIEIKSKKGTDGVNHPDPKKFSELLIAVLKEKTVLDRTIIQSFDVRPLQYIHTTYPSINLSYLVDVTSDTFKEQFDKLGFQPHTYSPNVAIVTKEAINECHEKGIKVLPWTVNNVSDMQRLKKMGVDGIISDYPNLFAQLRANK
jgi:glycerophosphoryl diester phosphodiesterase